MLSTLERRVEGREGGGGQLVRKWGRRQEWEGGAESFIEIEMLYVVSSIASDRGIEGW